LFDFTEPDFICVMAEICGQQGIAADAADVWKRFLRASLALRSEHHRDPVYTRYHDAWRLQFERVFRELRVTGDSLAGADHLRRRLADAPAFEETALVLEALRSRYEVALLSNADDDFLTACLRRNKLEFDVIVTSESAGAIKPNRAIFDKLAEKMQLPPLQILYVGDNPIPDVLGPIRAGMLAAWVNRRGYRKPRGVPEAHVRVRSLTELVTLLAPGEQCHEPEAGRHRPRRVVA
jgi:2-haloalkanoic acid dehalogenase type II